eukprot:TRINITY_DN100654_c0_g1_i1.p1 TRINITY_DN100654_c0_g1~~TRINITY_DN100654_c0_g1_i1.p1  ORF type:complete len:211 (+),score=16.13 TRINITY_DN100654_c0_g1_i1:28-633(+)
MSTQALKKVPTYYTEILKKLNNKIPKWRGRVYSNKMDKTATVVVPRYTYNYKLKYFIRTHKKFKAHDEHNECRIGDVVEITLDKKRSKTKAFIVSQILVPNRTGYEPLWPIERQPPTLTPEKSINPMSFMDHDIYRDDVEGLHNPYMVDDLTSRAGGPSVPYPEPLGRRKYHAHDPMHQSLVERQARKEKLADVKHREENF